MNLDPQVERFVLHFGEMGGRWGVNRTVGQIYALLFLSQEPLHADMIAETLGISRSNVSMSLRELQSWRLLNISSRIGDRRDYYSAPQDVWEIFRTLVEEKRKREVDPTLSLLRSILMEDPQSAGLDYERQRIADMLELIELACSWFDDVHDLPPETLRNLMRLGSKVQKVLGFAGKIRKSDQIGGQS